MKIIEGLAFRLVRWLCRVEDFYSNGCPPLWLRYIIPTRVIDWINRELPVCGCGPITWSRHASDSSWIPKRSCWDGPCGKEYDYCGKFQSVGELCQAIDRWDAPEWTISFKEAK